MGATGSAWKRCEKEPKPSGSQVTSRGPRTLDDRAWTRYLAGELPDYPERILQANYAEVCRRLQMVMEDEADLTKVDEHHWQQRNPVVTEALEHLTMGGPQTIYWGGLAQGRVRYFDVEERRAGLPEDVAALVSGLSEDGVELSLVNLSPAHARTVIIQAGCFGEHRVFNAQGRRGRDGRRRPLRAGGAQARHADRPILGDAALLQRTDLCPALARRRHSLSLR